MRVHKYQTELWLPLPPEELYSFFADAANLDAITLRLGPKDWRQ